MFARASDGDPNNFTPSMRINDHRATGLWPATAGWNWYAYSGILYSAYMQNYNLMFDWWNNTGIDGAPGT